MIGGVEEGAERKTWLLSAAMAEPRVVQVRLLYFGLFTNKIYMYERYLELGLLDETNALQ